MAVISFAMLRDGILGRAAWQREDVNAHQAGAHLGGFSTPVSLGQIELPWAYRSHGCVV